MQCTTGVYAVRSAGIDPATGNEIFIKKDGSYTYEWKQSDEVLIGDSTRRYGAFQTSLVYKGFSFGASFSYRVGGMFRYPRCLTRWRISFVAVEV